LSTSGRQQSGRNGYLWIILGYSGGELGVPGQALWIYEKVQSWTDNHGNPEDALSVDAMLDDISLYWFTDTAASSARIYWENTRSGKAGLSGGRIALPRLQRRQAWRESRRVLSEDASLDDLPRR